MAADDGSEIPSSETGVVVEADGASQAKFGGGMVATSTCIWRRHACARMLLTTSTKPPKRVKYWPRQY